MKKTSVKILIIAAIVFAFLIPVVYWYFQQVNIPVLQPKGTIAYKEYRLMMITLAMSLIVVIPVFALLFLILWRYREGNKKAKYSPDFDHSRIIETVWWLIPTALILILGVIIWRSSYDLDPYKPLSSTQKTLKIQVIAMDWKWLFIYPEQHIASVNYLQIPIKTPIHFEVTADAPMNSFWIPQLGSQIYAMPGMSSNVNLMATSPGVYRGSSANISGRGFASMHFNAKATDQAGFDAWVAEVRQSPQALSYETYTQLAKPGTVDKKVYYKQTSGSLYDTILMKYMLPSQQTQTGQKVDTQ